MTRRLLRSAVFVARVAAVAAFLFLAGVPIGYVCFLWMIGFPGLGTDVYLPLAVVSGAAAYLAWLCMPWPREERAAPGPSLMDWPGVPADQDGPAPELDELYERLEATLALPARLPPHEYRIRPAVPPKDSGHV